MVDLIWNRCIVAFFSKGQRKLNQARDEIRNLTNQPINDVHSSYLKLNNLLKIITTGMSENVQKQLQFQMNNLIDTDCPSRSIEVQEFEMNEMDDLSQ